MCCIRIGESSNKGVPHNEENSAIEATQEKRESSLARGSCLVIKKTIKRELCMVKKNIKERSKCCRL